MPKLGMEPIRKEALVKATIVEIGRTGSLDVTVSQIARRAGMSPALAAACDLRLSIPGSGAVESLNVAAAAAVLLAQWTGRRP